MQPRREGDAFLEEIGHELVSLVFFTPPTSLDNEGAGTGASNLASGVKDPGKNLSPGRGALLPAVCLSHHKPKIA